jgi:hypothetical protein
MKKVQKSIEGIFKDIQSNKKEAIQATHQYGVFKIGSTGKTLKKASYTCITKDEATKKATEMEELNPGMKFTAKVL